MYIIPKGETYKLPFLLTDATNNEDAELDLEGTVTVYLSKNGGAFASYAGTVTEIGRGWYYVDLTTTHTNTEGPLLVEAVVSGTTNIWRWPCQVVPRAVVLDDVEPDRIADHTIRRNFDNVEASSDGDTLDKQSLIGMAAQLVNVVSQSGSTVTIKKADGTTTFYTITVEVDPTAAPVIGLS